MALRIRVYRILPPVFPDCNAFKFLQHNFATFQLYSHNQFHFWGYMKVRFHASGTPRGRGSTCLGRCRSQKVVALLLIWKLYLSCNLHSHTYHYVITSSLIILNVNLSKMLHMICGKHMEYEYYMLCAAICTPVVYNLVISHMALHM